MNIFVGLILAYLIGLLVYNLYKARKIRSQEDFMVAGRSLSLKVMVFTLICTWIGSGTFIAGAEYAAKAGWSSLWLPAGAWVGIAVIYFLAAKIRTFGQYTIGDILEVRYGKFARLFGALALVISFTTIVSYQFRAGGYILNVLTDGAVTVEVGQFITAAFVITLTAIGGMVAVAHTDLPNGIIILLACVMAVPFAVQFAGGWEAASAMLPASHFQTFSQDFGEHPLLKAGGYFLATMLLLMGVQSMYQKFYSAKTPKEAKTSVALWIVGTIVVETLVIVIAIYGAANHWKDIQQFEICKQLQQEVLTGQLPLPATTERAGTLVRQLADEGAITAAQARELGDLMNRQLAPLTNDPRRFEEGIGRLGKDPASIVLVVARDLAGGNAAGFIIGVLLLAAACAVVVSTGMNYLLSPSTNVMRDVYQRFIRPEAAPERMVALQKIFIVVIGLCAFLLIFIPTVLHSKISVLKYSYFAYTIYGVAITPALIAALSWRRVTRQGGLASIISGAIMVILLEIAVPAAFPQWMRGPAGSQDPFGVPGIYLALAVSLACLVVVSYLTPKPDAESLKSLFPEA